MVSWTEPRAGSEVGTAFARAILLKHAVDPSLHQVAEEDIRRIERIAKQDIVCRERIKHASQQGLLLAALACARTCGRIEHRATTETDQRHRTADREAQTGLLTAWLRIVRLVFFRVRQGYGGTIDQARRSSLPMPPGWRAVCNPAPDLLCQGRDNFSRQPQPSLAVGAGISATARQPLDYAFDRRIIDCLSTATIGREHLPQKHRRSLRWREQSFAMCWQQFLDFVEHLRAGQQVEKCVDVGLFCLTLNTFLLLQRRTMVSMMHEGWLSGWLVLFCDYTVSPMPAFTQSFQ